MGEVVFEAVKLAVQPGLKYISGPALPCFRMVRTKNSGLFPGLQFVSDTVVAVALTQILLALYNVPQSTAI